MYVSKVLKHTIHSQEPWKYISKIAIKFYFKKMTVLLRSCHCFKSVFAVVCYSRKMQVTCIKALKPFNYWEKLLRNTSTIVVKMHFTKRNSFTKVTWWLQNSDLPLLQFDVRQKCGQRVSQDVNRKNHTKNIWRYIWTTAGKIWFTNIISFTKVTWSSETMICSSLIFHQNAWVVCQRS